jgi:hypothetical protein
MLQGRSEKLEKEKIPTNEWEVRGKNSKKGVQRESKNL